MSRNEYIPPSSRKKIVEDISNYRYTAVGIHKRASFVIEIDNFYKRDFEPSRSDKGRYRGIGLAGTGLMIHGKPKSRKTTLATMIVAAALRDDGGKNYVHSRQYENIRVNCHIDNYIIYFDTEQSRGEFEKTQNNIMRMAQLEEVPDNYLSYSLKHVSGHMEKIYIIESIIYELLKKSRKPEDKIAIVVIDHMLDLTSTKNSPEDVKYLLDQMAKLESETGAVFIYNIHENKKDNEPTGLLGGDLAKKVSSIIQVEKKSNKKGRRGYDNDDEDEDQTLDSIASYRNDRHGEIFKKFCFNFDGHGFPVVIPENNNNF